jgi:tetraacyldisaccharide 4'-kinase
LLPVNRERGTAVPQGKGEALQRLDRYWYSLNPIAIALWPLGLLFCGFTALRRWAYRLSLLTRYRLGVPVIVVGNITVGGNGKTPLVVRLVEMLREVGYRPGIISRGYGGVARNGPTRVDPGSDPREVGDEPVLLARRCGCPVVVAPDRVAAARNLLVEHDCNLILSDDGLQHYRLDRDIEIAVVDGKRRLGNRTCLPSGPLREPAGRLRTVDFVVGNGRAEKGEYLMTLHGDLAINLADHGVTCGLTGFRGELVHAVAGIGDPSRFFDFLKGQGVHPLEHPFPDHHPFVNVDLEFGDSLPVLMTEKDAVKCEEWARDWYWYVPVKAQLDPEFEQQLLRRLERLRKVTARADSESEKHG